MEELLIVPLVPALALMDLLVLCVNMHHVKTTAVDTEPVLKEFVNVTLLGLDLMIALVRLFWEPARMEALLIHVILVLVSVQLDLLEISVNVQFARTIAQETVNAIVVLAVVILDLLVRTAHVFSKENVRMGVQLIAQLDTAIAHQATLETSVRLSFA